MLSIKSRAVLFSVLLVFVLLAALAATRRPAPADRPTAEAGPAILAQSQAATSGSPETASASLAPATSSDSDVMAEPATPAVVDVPEVVASATLASTASTGSSAEPSGEAVEPSMSEHSPAASSAHVSADKRSGKLARRSAEALSRAEIAALLQSANLSDPAERARVVARMEAAEQVRYAAVLAKAEELGIPVKKEGPGNRVARLYDFRGDEPLYRVTMNRNAAISSAANLVGYAPYNLSGARINVGVWDAGSVRRTHQEFTQERVTNVNAVATDDHSTHVAGTIGGAGVTASARGMATNVWIDSYDWDSDYSEMTAAAAATASDTNRLPLSNHSYGYDATTADMGVYNDEAVTTDALAVGLPYYLPCWAAGNEQDVLTAKGGYQSITYNGLAKNLLTVGAVNDAVSGTNRSLGGASIAYFSSLGPSDDGRIKPDVVANGIDLYSTLDTSDTAYDSYSGTSMATPSTAGSAALLAELYAREFSGQFMRASMMKALLIHTADDLGTAGPDYTFGWGLINTKAAADVILGHKASPGSPRMIEGSVTTATRAYTNTFTWDGSSPIRATLCWTDPAGTAQADNSRTPVLKNNLDLRIIAPDGSTVYQPYVMPFVGSWSDAAMATAATTGSNYVDNVERVDLATPAQSGVYKVIVSYGGTLTGSSQTYSLVLTGGTDIEQAVIVRTGLELVSESCGAGNGAPDPGEVVGLKLALRNTGTLATGNLIATLLATGGVTLPSAAQSYGALPVGGSPVTNSFTFTASGTCGDTITVTFALQDGTNNHGAITQDYTLGDTTELTASFTNTAAITINDNASATPYPSTIAVAGMAGTVAKVTVRLAGFAHDYPADVDVVLASPGGQRVALLGGSGGSTPVSGVTLVLDDEAAANVGSPITSGTYRPTGSVSTMPTPAPAAPYEPSLSAFNGVSPNGTWSLYVVDTAAVDSGSIAQGWSISITAGEPVCCASNQPPEIAPLAPQSVAVGTALSFPVIAQDFTDGDTVTLYSTNVPAGASFPTANRVAALTNQFVWNNASPTGSYTVTFLAGDKDGTNSRNVTIEVYLPPPQAPAPIWASATNGTGFTATWGAAAGADSYELDVSLSALFQGSGPGNIGGEPFAGIGGGTINAYLTRIWTNNGIVWTGYKARTDQTIDTGALCLRDEPSSYFVSSVMTGGIDTLSILSQQKFSGSGGTFDVFVNGVKVGSALPISTEITTHSISNIDVTGDFTLMVTNNGAVRAAFDNLSWTGGAGGDDAFVPGYENLAVAGTSQAVTGLTPGETYYFRARAVNGGGASSNSAVANVTTLLTDTLPSFTSSAGPYSTTAGVSLVVGISATGFPAPTLALQGTTASSGYSFTAGQLTYIAPTIDLGARTFTFIASNSVGVVTQVVNVTVYDVPAGPPLAPSAIWASMTNATEYTAAWSAAANATSYRLDVATNATFSSSSSMPEISCAHTGKLGAGTGGTWTESNLAQGSASGNSYIQMSSASAALTTPTLNFNAKIAETLVFRGATYGTVSAPRHDIIVSISTNDGLAWSVLGTNRPTSSTYSTFTYDLSSFNGTAVKVRFSADPSATASQFARLDEVVITNMTSSAGADFVPGYSNLTVAGTSQLVTGLTEGVTYFMRARAVNVSGTSPDSPTGSVVTAASTGDGDINDDGIPDAWLTGHGLDATNSASTTTPGGGATFGEAYAHDISPNLPAPVGFNAIVESERAVGSSVQLHVDPSSTSRVYDVFWRASLLDANAWTGFNLNMTGTGSRLILTVTNSADQLFYRTGVKIP